MFLPHPRVKVGIVGSLPDREVAYLASDRQGSNFESCVGRTVSSQSSQSTHLQWMKMIYISCTLYVLVSAVLCNITHITWAIISPSSGGSPGPVQPIRAQRCTYSAWNPIHFISFERVNISGVSDNHGTLKDYLSQVRLQWLRLPGIRVSKTHVSCPLNPHSAKIDFSRQNLTPVDVRFWQLKSIFAL